MWNSLRFRSGSTDLAEARATHVDDADTGDVHREYSLVERLGTALTERVVTVSGGVVLVDTRSGAPDSKLTGLTSREREISSAPSIFLKLGLGNAEDVSKRIKATLIFLVERRLGVPGPRSSTCPADDPWPGSLKPIPGDVG